MEEGVLWRADVMEGLCAVALGKDIYTSITTPIASALKTIISRAF
jgi:hypothetical protein